MFGPQVGVDGKAQGDITAGATDAAVAGAQLPSNVRFTACPNTCLFGDGAQYQVNSTMVENQVNYYQVAMVKLYTKYDSQADTSGSCGLGMRRQPTSSTASVILARGRPPYSRTRRPRTPPGRRRSAPSRDARSERGSPRFR